MSRWRIRGWGDAFEFALTIGGLYAGLIYALGPDRLRSIYSYVNQFTDGTAGMQFLGAAWFISGFLLLLARALQPRDTNFRLYGHAFGTGVYFLMGMSLFWPVVTGGPASSGAAFVPYWLVTMGHLYLGLHQPAWIKSKRNDPGE